MGARRHRTRVACAVRGGRSKALAPMGARLGPAPRTVARGVRPWRALPRDFVPQVRH